MMEGKKRGKRVKMGPKETGKPRTDFEKSWGDRGRQLQSSDRGNKCRDGEQLDEVKEHWVKIKSE